MHALRSGSAKTAIEEIEAIEEIMEVEGREVQMTAITEVITLDAGGTIIMARETTSDKAAARVATTALPHRNQGISGDIKAHRSAI